ncbi:MAG: YkgJ family cysteine cluster protein [Candidatus Kariarchaeaceae archaeon]
MIKLPIIIPGTEIGVIDLEKHSFTPNETNHIYFKCSNRIKCCSTLDIPVTSFDIARIQQSGYELDQIIENLSPIILPSKTPIGKTEKVYKLKKKPFDGTCTFLHEKLCVIHENKPFACKTYPFGLEIVNESRIRILVHQEKLCQSITPVDRSNSNNEELLHELLQNVKNEMKERKIPL